MDHIDFLYIILLRSELQVYKIDL